MKKIIPLYADNPAYPPPTVVVVHTNHASNTKFECYIHQNILRNVPLHTLASECNMTISTFKAHFGRLFGTSPHRWFVLQRLNLAHKLLLTTDTQIKTIAYECGFSSPSQFIRLFHKHFGVTPAHFRAQFGGVLHRV